ncbi:unnamed protein product [Urochloa humidicola]
MTTSLRWERGLGFRCGDGERHGSRESGIRWSLEEIEIFPSRMVGSAGALRYSDVLCSPVLHGESGLQTKGPPHWQVPDELDMRDHNIVSAAKIYAAPSRVHEELSPTVEVRAIITNNI